MRFSGKVAIVTGGARGMGKAIAQGFAREGASVVIFDVLEDLAKQTAEQINSAGGKAVAMVVDISSTKQINDAVNAAIQQFGKVDILVNNAAWEKIEPFVQSSEPTWDKVIAIDFKGPVALTRAVLDGMISRNYGKIICIASDAGRVGSSGEAVYSGCKAALIAFSKTVARETARYGLNLNCVCPGPTETPMFAENMEKNPKLLEAMKKIIPLGRYGKPEDIAAAVMFLASDDASYITGQTLSVSGGLTMV